MNIRQLVPESVPTTTPLCSLSVNSLLRLGEMMLLIPCMSPVWAHRLAGQREAAMIWNKCYNREKHKNSRGSNKYFKNMKALEWEIFKVSHDFFLKPGWEGGRRRKETERGREEEEATILILERLPSGPEDGKLTLWWIAREQQWVADPPLVGPSEMERFLPRKLDDWAADTAAAAAQSLLTAATREVTGGEEEWVLTWESTNGVGGYETVCANKLSFLFLKVCICT